MSDPALIPASFSLPKEAILHGESIVAVPSTEEKPGPSDIEPELEWTYPDGGLRAWLVVFGCSIMAGTSLGWGLVWGVLQDFFHSDKFKDSSLGTLSLVGGIFAFCMNCSAYFFGGVGERHGYKRMMALSCFLGYLSLLASAFPTQLYHIFLFQGVFMGLASGISLPLYMALPSQWFLRKRGLATGIAVAGSGIGSGVGSLLIRPLLLHLGYKKTMLVYSAAYAGIWACAWLMMAERRAPGYKEIQKHWLPKTRGPVFYCIALSVFTSVFGFLSPCWFITTYVKEQVPSLDPQSLLVVVPLAVMNVSGGIGRILAGRLADRFGPLNVFFATFLLGGLAQLLLWTLARSYASVVAFSAVYGLVGCWYVSLIPVVCAQLFGLNDLATVTGFMTLATSPGQLAGASIGGAVLAGSGGDWRAVSVYSGCAMLLGSCFVLCARFSYDRRVWAKV